MVITKTHKKSLLTALIVLLAAGFFLISGGGFKALAQDMEQDRVDTFQNSNLEMMMLDALNKNRETSLGLNSLLTRTAKVIAQRMIDNDFLRQTEGIDFEQLVSGFGYAYNAVFMLDSAVMSSNYLPEEKAVDLLYASLMEDDTDNFSLRSRDVGISIIQIRILLKGRQMNVYVAVVIGADPETDRYAFSDDMTDQLEELSDYMADQFEVLLNQFRATPEFVLRNMGYDTDSYSGDADITTGLPPLRRSSVDEIEGVKSGEALAFIDVDLDDMEADRVVMLLFSEMVETNINSLLTDIHNRVGIEIAYAPSYDDQEKFRVRFSAELKFDHLVPDMDKALIKGVAFKDDNENHIYDPGEGIYYLPLYIPGTGIHMRTGFAGQFQTELKMGWYDILLFNWPYGEYSAYYDTYTMDRYVMFSVLE